MKLYSIQDGRTARDRQLFEAFCKIYGEYFGNADDAEDVEAWQSRLQGPLLPAPEPVFQIILGLEEGDPDPDSSLLGGVVFEYYQDSACGLVTYLLVKDGNRGNGCGRALFEAAKARLKELAQERGVQLRAILVEARDPRSFREDDDRVQAYGRLTFFRSLGLKWLDIPYVQPALDAGKSRDAGLLAFIQPQEAWESAWRDSAVCFYREFFRALGVESPLHDSDYIAMEKALRDPALLLKEPIRIETATLAFAKTVLTFQLVTSQHTAEDQRSNRGVFAALKQRITEWWQEKGNRPPEPQRQDHTRLFFRSFEHDILAYSFLDSAPFFSNLYTECPVEIVVLFPEHYEYCSEGRVESLATRRTALPCRAWLSRTCFPSSAITVWHLALAPANGDVFTDADLIRLLHMRKNEHETDGFASMIQFQLSASKRKLTFAELLTQLHGDTEPIPSGAVPDSLALQLCFQSIDETVHAHWDRDKWEELFQLLVRLNDSNAEEALRRFSSKDPKAKSIIQALNGVVGGIFDFHRLDEGEFLDTLMPDVATSSEYFLLRGGALLSVSRYDELIEHCEKGSGASPYLLLPSALLLHNQYLLQISKRAVVSSIAAKKLPDKERSRDRAVSAIKGLLPNVFQYRMEKQLVEFGTEQRAYHHLQEWVENRIDEATAAIDALRERRTAMATHIIEFVAVLIPAFIAQQIVLSFYEAFLPDTPKVTQWAVAVGVVAMIALVLGVLQIARYRR